MSNKFQDSVSFVVMTILIFIVLNVSFTSLTGSSGAGIRYLDLHWIVLREDLAQVLTVVHIYAGTLVALTAVLFCLTWVLSRVLKVLHHKKSNNGWLLFAVVVVIYLMLASMQDFVFT